MMLITKLTGFSRLVGLGHAPWLPLVYFLWTRLGEIPPGDLFGLWARALIVLNIASLVVDTIDVVRYLAGDRKEMVEGL